ncbi:MAG TPA: hypothetical protein VNK48_14430 [Xanthobacteraceae bacterium]|nr:hypothetical protein [Xanthobacteraceae bacterium]
MRRRRTRIERLAIAEAHGWQCCICRLKIDPLREPWILEHVLALAAGGRDSDDNIAPAHQRCAIEKTKDDLRAIAKDRRVLLKRFGVKKRATFRGWRRFSGEVVRNPRWGRE